MLDIQDLLAIRTFGTIATCDQLWNAFNDDHPNSYYILGDSGYPLRPWLLKPLEAEPVSRGEVNYNKLQKATRTITEHVNGILKMRFRYLLKYRSLHYAPENASRIINFCCAMHNMCVKKDLPDVPPENVHDDVLEGLHMDCSSGAEIDAMSRVNPFLAKGRLLQKQLIDQYFRHI